MKIWLIVTKVDGYIWVENAWDDDATADNWDGFQADIEEAKKNAELNEGELRVVPVVVEGLLEAFDVKELKGKVVDG